MTKTNMKSLYLISLIFIVPAKGQVSLDMCQEKAKANHPMIRQYDLITRSVEYSVANANKAYLPQVSITGLGAYVFTGIPSLSPGPPSEEKNDLRFIGMGQLSQVIWDGGAVKAQKQIIAANAEIEKAAADVSFQAIRERVNQVYFGLLVIDAQLEQLNVLRETITRNLKRISISKNNGLAYQTDVDELTAESMNLDQRVIEFTHARRAFLEMLGLLTGQALPETTTLARPGMLSAQAAQLNRPEKRIYANQRTLLNAQSSMTDVQTMPRIGLLGTAVLIGPGIKLGPSTLSSLAFGGLRVSWNTSGIYRSSKTRALERINLDKIAVQEDVFLFNLGLQLKQASSEIEKQKAILEKDREILALKSRIREGYQLKYDNGVSSMNDLINATNREHEIRTLQALHEVQLLMSLYNYQTLSGN